jgi:DNA-binding transcriptional LysR family regulator
MELRHLRYFVAVAERLNYRKAAEDLHVSQPALSTQIKDLEYETGVKLLERDTGGVRLTDAGSVLLQEARRLLAQAAAAVAAAKSAAAGRRGRLVIGSPGSVAARVLPGVLRAYRLKYPEVEVVLNEMSSPAQVAALASGAIQIGFAIADHAYPPDDLEHFTVWRSPMRAVVGQGHRLARVRRVALAELATEPILAIGDPRQPTPHAERTREIFRARGWQTRPLVEVDGLDSLLATVASGAGVTLLPAVVGDIRTGGVVLKPLTESGPDLFTELWVLWRDRVTSPLARNFVALLRQQPTRADRG